MVFFYLLKTYEWIRVGFLSKFSFKLMEMPTNDNDISCIRKCKENEIILIVLKDIWCF